MMRGGSRVSAAEAGVVGAKKNPDISVTVRAAAMLVLPMLCERTIFSL
jgi:hypothetical protein